MIKANKSFERLEVRKEGGKGKEEKSSAEVREESKSPERVRKGKKNLSINTNDESHLKAPAASSSSCTSSSSSAAASSSATPSSSSMISWLQHVSPAQLPLAVNAHMQTFHALRSARGSVSTSGPSEGHEKDLHTYKSHLSNWGLVAMPHDVTAPPCDILALSDKLHEQLSLSAAAPSSSHTHTNTNTSTSTHNQHSSSSHFPASKLASQWADGRDIQDSLYWVAYAAQTRVNAHRTSDASHVGPPDGKESKEATAATDVRGGWTQPLWVPSSVSEKKAHDILGEVDGEELLQVKEKIIITVLTSH